MKSAAAIAFDYRPSRWLMAAIVAIALLAAVSIFLSGLPLAAKFAVAAAACAYAAWTARGSARAPVRRAAWQPAGYWRVTAADDREFTAELVRGVARGAWIVLNLRRSDGTLLVLILGPDNCAADTRRRLRVRLARPSEP